MLSKQTAVGQRSPSNWPNFQLLLILFNNVIKQAIWKTSMVSTTLAITLTGKKIKHVAVCKIGRISISLFIQDYKQVAENK